MTQKTFAKKLAGVASGRAALYNLLIAVFEQPPDHNLLARIRGGEFERLLAGYRELGEKGFRAGLDKISSYQRAIRERPDGEVLTELAVDRTRILRGTGHTDMKPPYEGLYKKGAGFGESVRKVRRFYRKAGLVPDETVTEAADYLCVELDFMKQLCLREGTLRRDEGVPAQAIAQTIALQEDFLKMHLGAWVGAYCSTVNKHASTDFYRGFALIMDTYIRIDTKLLLSLLE
jgi:putative dimethyl sulfoxide reductase chaperone